MAMHVLACIWWFLGESFEDTRWGPPPEMLGQGLGTKDSYALYWAVCMTSGIGGNGMPTHTLAILYTAVVIMTGVFMLVRRSAAPPAPAQDAAAPHSRARARAPRRG